MEKLSNLILRMCDFPVEETAQKAVVPFREKIIGFARKIFGRPKKNPIQRALQRQSDIQKTKVDLEKRVQKHTETVKRLQTYNTSGNLKI